MMVKYTYKIVPKHNTASNMIVFDSSTVGSIIKPVTVSLIAGSPLSDKVRDVTKKLRDLVGDEIVDNARSIILVEAEELPMYEIPRVR